MRAVFAEVLAAAKAARIDTFNGSYGLMRGLAAAFVVLFALAAGKSAMVLGAMVVLFLLAVQRMHRYGEHYATELFTQFLSVKSKTAGPTG